MEICEVRNGMMTEKNEVGMEFKEDLVALDSSSLLPHPPTPRCKFLSVRGIVIVAAMLTVLIVASCAAKVLVVNREVDNDKWGVARSLKVLEKQVVILISSDGFRWGYNHKVCTPNIDRLRLNGTEAETGMYPVFPSMTFPNHYSIATGLYPAWHGIIANSFRDPDPSSDEHFYQGNLNPRWWLGEPIWVTVVKSGLAAATYFWPGSQVVKDPWFCPSKFCQTYNGSVPYVERVDTVLSYFDLPSEEIPSLVTLYFESPDDIGHATGPDAPQIADAVAEIDEMVGRLIAGLEKRNIFEDVSLILVGDHGMVGNCESRMIYLEDFSSWVTISPKWIDSTSPVFAVRPPLDVDVKTVYANLSKALSSGMIRNGNFLKIYLKEDLPERFHYSRSERIQPIIGILSEGYKLAQQRSNTNQCGGSHGYDNSLLSMRTICIAHGPQFARGRKVPSFTNIELYNVITSILGLKHRAPNNGSSSFVESILLPHK